MTATAVATATPAAPPTPVCGATPESGCRTPAVGGRATLALKDAASDAGDVLDWRWLRGAVTPISDFGDPRTTDTYELCVYDGTASVIMHATAPAGGLCGTSRLRPCWTATSRGFLYRNPALTPLGISRIVLRAGDIDGSAQIIVRGRGPNLELPTVFPLAQPVTVQLKNAGGACWEATYDAPATRNTAGPPAAFRDTAD